MSAVLKAIGESRAAVDLVVGIDSSTTSTKAIAWDREGRAVAEGRAPVPMRSPRGGWFEQEPEDWWAALVASLRDLGAGVALGRIAALSISNQRETVGFLDEAGRSVRPAMLWLDERSREDVDLVSALFGRERLIEVTGKTPDPTPAVYSLHWLRRKEPEHHARTAWIVDVHGYLAHRLTGRRVTSWGSADPHGTYDLGRMAYAEELIRAVGARPEQFFPAVRPGTVIGEVASGATGLRPGTPVVAGGGDGQASGLGTGVLGPGRAYLNLGTASVSGVYSAGYRTGPEFRTLTSLSGEGYILELCLRTGSFLTDWTVTRLFGADPKADPGVYDRLEREAEAVAVGAEGLLLLPYWSGAMTPFWDPDARGALVGLGAGHGRGHVYRALMEGVALDEAMGLDSIEAALGGAVDELVTIGGGARSALWRRIVADATGKPVRVSETVEASCLGAGMLAAVGAGWFRDAREAAAAMGGAVALTVEPDPGRHARYREVLAAYRELYPALSATFARLAKLRRED
jgi:sugar (pentulose or hexulose) kinase